MMPYAFVTVWFVLSGGSGYIPPLDVHAPLCGRPGAVVGVQVDRTINPTTLYWPDPRVADQHCVVDISAKVAEMKPGTYHNATTIHGKEVPFGTQAERYFGHDPHTTVYWVRDTTLLPRPTNLRILKP